MQLNFLKAKDTYRENSHIQKQMAKTLCDILIQNSKINFDDVFEFGCGVGIFSEILQENIKFKNYFLNDIYFFENPCKYKEFGVFDMNEIENHHFFNKKFDLIASNACMQWLNIDKVLKNLYHILKDDGILLFSTFGEQNYIQIKQATNLSLNYINLAQLKEKLSKYFNIIKIDEKLINLRFNNTLELFRHLKLSGVNSLGKFFIGKNFLKEFELKYQNILTYNPIFILCQKRIN